MPELPEVEVVRAGLAPVLTGATITSVEVFEVRSLRRHNPAFGPFESALTGQRVHAAVRRGKFLWFPLSGGNALVGHLGMSGQLLLRTPDAPIEARSRIRLGVEHPVHGELVVAFVDQRIFGSLAIDRMIASADGQVAGFSDGVAGDWSAMLPSQVAHIARDPLDAAFDEREWVAALSRRGSGIKRVLLDQTVVSGIGNIYADEALWASRLHFDQPASSLGRARSRRLLDEVRGVLHRALAEGGTSFDAQYVNVNGASGYFAHSLNAYGRTGSPCRRCARPILRERFMNRSSHFCAHCQRLRVP